MNIWFAVPSKRPVEEAEKCFYAWHRQGYKVALWRDVGDPLRSCDLELTGAYQGYAFSVNSLVSEILRRDPKAEWIVTGGDDTFPDSKKTATEIGLECGRYFGKLHGVTRPEFSFGKLHYNYSFGQFQEPRSMPWSTLGVMQPTGDRFAGGCIDRICGSPWMGREFCERAYNGNGPLWPEFKHMFVDEHLQNVALKLGILWQRRDLTNFHDHITRESSDGNSQANYGKPVPGFLAEAYSKKHWNEIEAIFRRLQSGGFSEAFDLRPPSAPVGL